MTMVKRNCIGTQCQTDREILDIFVGKNIYEMFGRRGGYASMYAQHRPEVIARCLDLRQVVFLSHYFHNR